MVGCIASLLVDQQILFFDAYQIFVDQDCLSINWCQIVYTHIDLDFHKLKTNEI